VSSSPDFEARMGALVGRDQDALRCPYPFFAQLRAERPVYFSDALGAWAVTSYDDVVAVLHDTERFSSFMPTGPQRRGEVLGPMLRQLAADPDMADAVRAVFAQGSATVLLNADPPDHVRQRKLVTGAFRPSRLRAMEPSIRDLAVSLAAGFRHRGHVEVVAEFAVPLPMTVIARALGVGDHDLATFKRWSDDLVMPIGNQSPSLDQVRGYVTSSVEFADYFRAVLHRRRAEPRDDIVSDVANAELDGERLSEAEQLAMLTQFLVAGNETTTKLVTNIALHLAEDAELQARVRADRQLVEGLVEEALRFEAPVGGLFRTAKVDVALGGQTIGAGDAVWVLYGAANRDGARFAEPDRFDECRADGREHLSFGHGEHYCIGAGLARLEARLGTEALLDATRDLRLAAGNDFAMEDTFILRGLRRLDLEFDPA